jgi:hypothetical protein
VIPWLFNLETAMEPAKYAKDTKTGALSRIARLTQRVNLVLCPPSFDGKKMEESASRFPAEGERAAGGVAPLSKAVWQMAIFAVLPATSGTAARIAAGRTGLETCATPPRPRRCKYLRSASWTSRMTKPQP